MFVEIFFVDEESLMTFYLFLEIKWGTGYAKRVQWVEVFGSIIGNSRESY